ncbi:NAD synthetase [Crocosphaera sp. UHCC 0190]|nr:NAD synthetase [Crocosphaera sp. UHCC 0190]MEA5511596.1 NAD synthetase [Crocosphaera sp. UHCC 0190]
METNTILDWILGSLAIIILMGGMIMLLSGTLGMGDK